MIRTSSTRLPELVISSLLFFSLLHTGCGYDETRSRKVSLQPQSDAPEAQKAASDSSASTSTAEPKSGSRTPTPDLPAPTPAAVPNSVTTPATLNWKALLLSGDSSIKAFDNARKQIGSILESHGVLPENIRHLSMSNAEINSTVLKASASNIEGALTGLKIAKEDACLIYMTSHGSSQGFYLQGQPTLLPSALDSILAKTCGAQPTVVMVSSCYSGLFAEPLMQKENRIILTAAAKDRTSFGCGVENEYTFWDDCLIDLLPKASEWKQLASDIKACIDAKEQGSVKPSLPQSFFGAGTTTLPAIGT